MRDLLVLAITSGGAFFGLFRPWIGVLVLAVLAYLNPHRYAWGFSRSLPVYLIVFGCTVVGMIINKKDRQPFPWTRETVLFIFLLTWFTLTTFWAPDYPQQAREKWEVVMKIYMGLIPTYVLINSRERLRWLIITIALSFGLIGFKGGIFALGTAFHHRVWGPEGTFYGGNNEIALALSTILPLVLLCTREVKNGLPRIFFFCVFGFTICAVISSWSRGGLLTVCVVLGALILCGRRKWLSIPLLGLALLLAVPNLPEEWFARMHTIQTYEEDNSAQGRIMAWRFAIDRAVAHPLTGGGFDTFLDSYVDAHSGYFKILGEHGFLALGVWVSLLFGTIVALQRLRWKALLLPDMEWVRSYARAVQISLLGFSVGGAFLNVAYWDIFYQLVAICAVMKVMVRNAEQQVAAVAPQPRRVPYGKQLQPSASP